MRTTEPKRRRRSFASGGTPDVDREALRKDVEDAREALSARVRMIGWRGSAAARSVSRSRAMRRLIAAWLQRAPSSFQYSSKLPSSERLARADYQTSSGKAAQFGAFPGERFNVEPAQSEFAVAWTTTWESDSLLDVLWPVWNSDGPVRLIINSQGVLEEHHLSAFRAAAQINGSHPAFWRVEFGEHTITWEHAGDPSNPDGYGVIGFIGTSYVPEDVGGLVRATATPEIAANAEEMLSACAPIIDSVVPTVHRERSRGL